jgi:hypothetical protein
MSRRYLLLSFKKGYERFKAQNKSRLQDKIGELGKDELLVNLLPGTFFVYTIYSIIRFFFQLLIKKRITYLALCLFFLFINFNILAF